ncbi:hypothetical protein, partial [Litorivivens sp.]|uniref:hypothetical protein n=1 Tax=Litorivivens sp. TaxID=2020868 RepID=UPI003562EEC3
AKVPAGGKRHNAIVGQSEKAGGGEDSILNHAANNSCLRSQIAMEFGALESLTRWERTNNAQNVVEF